MVLGVAILNKAGGAFGVLSLLTGHPINFWQWLYNVSCLCILPFYISALSNLTVKFRNVRKISFACLIYTFDTAFGLLYTFYFTYFWFSSEDTNPTGNERRDLGVSGGIAAEAVQPGKGYTISSSTTDLSQSASPARELFLTVSATLITTCLRFYFNLVMISFSRSLIKQYTNDTINVNIIDEEAQEIFSRNTILSRIKKAVYELEMRSKDILTEYFQ